MAVGPRDERFRNDVATLTAILTELAKKSQLLDDQQLHDIHWKVKDFGAAVGAAAVSAGLELPKAVPK